MKLKLTEDQYRALEPYEDYMRRALRSGSGRNPGRAALEMMNGIYNEVAGVRLRLNMGCMHCILRVQRDCGVLYFHDKEEREKAAPAETIQTAETPRKAQVAVRRIKDIAARRKIAVKAGK